MITFYDPDCTESSKSLPIEESRHAIKSLRIRINEAFDVINGNGLKLNAVVTANENGLLEYEIQDSQVFERKSPKLHMAVSPLKQTDRFEYFIEKATELGVDEISPIICARTEKPKIKKERLERIIISAMKQSGNAFMPILNEAISLEEVINGANENLKFIGHCENDEKLDLSNLEFKDDAIFLIGPEGDFNQNEIDHACANGFKSISLGDLTLRTETAALTVSSYFQLTK